MTNTTTETWGNIELPGLSDEELFKKDWNLIGAVQERNQSKEYQETMNSLYNSNDYKKQRKKIGQQLAQDNIWQQNHNKGIETFLSDQARKKEWMNNVNASRDKTITAKMKPLVTPDGVFRSQKQAAEFYNITVGSIQSRRNQRPDRYYYISLEEYIMLTGKEI